MPAATTPRQNPPPDVNELSCRLSIMSVAYAPRRYAPRDLRVDVREPLDHAVPSVGVRVRRRNLHIVNCGTDQSRKALRLLLKRAFGYVRR